jgi:hypothetical protein
MSPPVAPAAPKSATSTQVSNMDSPRARSLSIGARRARWILQRAWTTHTLNQLNPGSTIASEKSPARAWLHSAPRSLGKSMAPPVCGVESAIYPGGGKSTGGIGVGAVGGAGVVDGAGAGSGGGVAGAERRGAGAAAGAAGLGVCGADSVSTGGSASVGVGYPASATCSSCCVSGASAVCSLWSA